MNVTEHLLACLAEECGEVAKECHKSLRFGIDDKVTLDPLGPRGTEGPTNREKIISELNDLLGVVRLMEDFGILPPLWCDTQRQIEKTHKVRRFMGYAVKVGALTDHKP